MRNYGTDLAAEASELWRETAAETDRLPGVTAKREERDGYFIEHIVIETEEGAALLGKPRGSYITLELPPLTRLTDGGERAAALLAALLRELLPLSETDSVLVAGLGNRAVTPDNLGPLSLRYTLITRHLIEALPEEFGSLRPVMGLETGVMGTTGVESGAQLRAFVRELQPKAVIVIDALASRRLRRVCRTVQLSDTGIVPGSGVGNAREAVTAAELGVPVIAVGVPTVVDAAVLAADLSAASGLGAPAPAAFSAASEGLIVTPREIDTRIGTLARILGLGISLALQEGLAAEEIRRLLE